MKGAAIQAGECSPCIRCATVTDLLIWSRLAISISDAFTELTLLERRTSTYHTYIEEDTILFRLLSYLELT